MMTVAENPERFAARMLDRALVSRGNVSRLEELFRKAKAGDPVTVAFIGGSITQGCHASLPELRYVERVCRWFRETFPDSAVTGLNAGVGATTSLTGVHRLQSQVLASKPDLVIVDFAVNDRDRRIFRESYESLVRDILSAPSSPAVVELFMIIEGGLNEQAAEIEIGLHYGVPMISYRNLIWGLLRDGAIAWNDVSTDEVHPNDIGHGLCAGLITAFFSGLLAESGAAAAAGATGADAAAGTAGTTGTAGTAGTASRDAASNAAGNATTCPAAQSLPEPVYGDRFTGGSILGSASIRPDKIEGFIPCPEGFQAFRDGWLLDGQSAPVPCRGSLSVDIEARNIVLLYKKTVRPESGTLTVRASSRGRPAAKPIILDTRFKGGWGDYSETAEIVLGEKKGKYRIEVVAEGPAVILGFLVS